MGSWRTSAATTTETELDLLLAQHQAAHHGPDPLAKGDRVGLGHGGVHNGVELLAGKPLIWN